MKVLIATGLSMFGTDVERDLADELARRLRRRGHRIELLRLPTWGGSAERMVQDMLLSATLEISNADHVVATSLPAALVRHHSSSIWIADDVWMRAAMADDVARAPVARAVMRAIGGARHVSAASPGLAAATSALTGFRPHVLRPGRGRRWSAVLDGALP